MTCRSSPPAASRASSASSSSLHLVILAAREGWHTRELTRALEARGHTGAVVPYEGLVAVIGGRSGLRSHAADLDRADAVLARIIPSGSLEQIIYRVDALHRLEDRGVRVMNSPRAIERTVDKFWTSALLEQCGLPTPDTIVCETPEEAFAAQRAEGGDVIVKPLFGSMGLGMVRVSDEEMAFRVFKAIETIRGVYYLQRTIDHDGRDVRAFVVGGRVLAAIERTSTGWRTNLSRGGAARAVQLSEAWSALAVRAAAAVGAEYAGVDLLPARDGPVYVLEVNGIPGWEGLQGATGLDVAGAVIDQLVDPRR
jgi:RimK family alpha-L-glutamate ligase